MVRTVILIFCLTIICHSQNFPLKVSANDRYLVDQNNSPFFLNADAAWSLIAQTTYSDADYYLSNRHFKGFNGVLINLIEHHFADLPILHFQHQTKTIFFMPIQ